MVISIHPFHPATMHGTCMTSQIHSNAGAANQPALVSAHTPKQECLMADTANLPAGDSDSEISATSLQVSATHALPAPHLPLPAHSISPRNDATEAHSHQKPAAADLIQSACGNLEVRTRPVSSSGGGHVLLMASSSSETVTTVRQRQQREVRMLWTTAERAAAVRSRQASEEGEEEHGRGMRASHSSLPAAGVHFAGLDQHSWRRLLPCGYGQGGLYA